MYLYHQAIKIVPGDDIFFGEVSSQYSFFEYLKFRYLNWTGRLTAESFLYYFSGDNVWLWRLVNSFFIMLLAYGISRIIVKKFSLKYFVLSLALVAYGSQSILSSGLFWITGSMVYLWPISLGLFAMIPYADISLRKNEEISYKTILFSAIAGSLAALANEQVALCIICFSSLSVFYHFQKYKKIHSSLTALIFLFLIETVFSIFAPGNDKRFTAEIATWFPGFADISIKDRTYLSIVWFYNKFFGEFKWLILLLSVIIISLYANNKFTKTKLTKGLFAFFSGMLGVAISTMFLGKGSYLFDFESITKHSISNNLFGGVSDLSFYVTLFPYVFWTLYSLSLLYILILVSEKKYFTTLCILASVASMSVMFFSPTIYASGNRTLTVSAILITLVCLEHIRKIENKPQIVNVLFYSLPITNIILLLVNWLLNGYSVLY